MKRNIWKLMIVLMLVICVLPMAAFAEGEDEPFKCPKHQWIMTGDTATCVSGGTSSWFCTVPGCGLTTTEPSAVNPANHVGFVEQSSTPPACGKEGNIHKVCSCGATQDVPIPALKHSWDAGVGTDPTCTTGGSKLYTCQNNCGLTTTETEEPLGHDWVATNTVPAICGQEGSADYKCSRCPETKHDILPGLRHNWDDGVVITAATCTTEGTKEYTCQNAGCPLGKVVQPYDALGHDWDDGVGTNATCGVAGRKVFTCKRDATHTKTEDYAALRHNWDDGVVLKSATCTEKGSKFYTCQNPGCPLGNVTQAYGPLDHIWNAPVETRKPSCGVEGLLTYTCGRDASHTKTDKIPATGKHNLSVMVSDRTYHWRYCQNPGCKYVETAYHEFSNWRVARAATEEKDGLLRKDCAYCTQKLWSSYAYSDNPRTVDPVFVPMAMMLLTAGALPVVLRYTKRKWKYWV